MQRNLMLYISNKTTIFVQNINRYEGSKNGTTAQTN